MTKINGTPKVGSPRSKTKVPIVLITVASMGVALVLLLIVRSQVSVSPMKPPSITGCIRLEVEYQPSVLEYFDILATNPGLLDSRERQFIESLAKITITDVQRIRALGDVVRSGRRSRSVMDVTDKNSSIRVNGYFGGGRIASFTVYNSTYIVTDDGQRFDYDGFPEISSLVPELGPFIMRMWCARALISIAHRISVGSEQKMEYPKADTWCDELLGTPRVRSDRLRRRIMDQTNGYQCVSAGEGRCHYAMNPNCRPDSPPGTVLVFETKAGWNQHGGPELFTFDNHDPKGGLVLLNDGTVKFIRTEEELKQLRWK